MQTTKRAHWSPVALALVLALAAGMAACGGDGGTGDEGTAVADVSACLEEAGFEVEEGGFNEELGETAELVYEKGDGGNLKIGRASFFESAERAESSFSNQKSIGISFSDEIVVLRDNVVFDWDTRKKDDPEIATIEGCL